MLKQTKIMNKKLLLGAAVLLVGLSLSWSWKMWQGAEQPSMVSTVSAVEEDEPIDTVGAVPITQELVSEKKLSSAALISGVPFTVQAPFAEWSNPIFQDACEEASIVMAAAWVSGKSLTKESAKRDIQALAAYQKKLLGHSADTSIEDTEKLLQDFLGVTTTEVKRGVMVPDIKEAVVAEKIVIVPTDGRKLGNPNFKAPGPPRHMLVIIGYDDPKAEFITNDPGTRKGEGYRYDQTVLYEAILDYPTGKHAPVTSAEKVMLTVGH